MYRTIIIFLVCINKLLGQSNFSEELLFWENKIYTETNNQNLVFQYHINKIDVYIKNDSINANLLNEFQYIKWSEISDSSLKAKYLYNMSLAYYLNNNLDYSDFYFQEYLKINIDTSVTTQLLGLLIYVNRDSLTFHQHYNNLVKKDSAQFGNLYNLYLINKQQNIDPKKYVLASRIIPGLGTMLAGDIWNGIGSLTFNGLAICASYLLVHQNLYIGAVGWGFLLLPRFYGGNVLLTKRTLERKYGKKMHKFALDNKALLDKKLYKYPLSFHRLNF